MPFPDDLLNPIEGPNPSGANLRYDPVYDKIKEARREEAQPPAGMTEQDRKVSDNAQVIKLATDLLTTKTKDLQLAAWLTEALLKQRGFGGLKDGLALCCGLVDTLGHALSRDRRRRCGIPWSSSRFRRREARHSDQAGARGREGQVRHAGPSAV
jgi:predicted component of type VI protein secretion system